MNTISGKINDNYGWEVTVFHKLREASDGVIFFDGKINWDRYLADHSPRFEIHIVIFNYTIIEINIYYLHHRAMKIRKHVNGKADREEKSR